MSLWEKSFTMFRASEMKRMKKRTEGLFGRCGARTADGYDARGTKC